MFSLKKQSPANELVSPPPQPVVNQPRTYGEVYVMPEKFSVQTGSGSGKSLIVAIIILIIVVIIIGTYFLYTMWQKDQSNILDNNIDIVNRVNTNRINRDISASVNTNSNANSNIDLNVNTDNINADSNINIDVDTGTNSTTDTNIDTDVSVAMVSPDLSSDADNDGLTDLEEGIIGTQPSRPDSDGDGFADGAEIKNGYNPAVASDQPKNRLIDAGFIATAVTNFSQDNFKIIYIKGWIVNMLTAVNRLVILTDTGETIRVSVRENEQRISVANWYLQNHSQVTPSQLTNVTVNNLMGVSAPDHLSVYLTDADRTKFYIFEYLMDENSEFRYPAIFEMIVNNFEVVTTDIIDGAGDLSGDSSASTTLP